MEFKRLLLYLFCCILLSACGEKSTPASDGIIYVPEDVAFSAPFSRMVSGCMSGDTIYLLGNLAQDPEDRDPGQLYGPWGLVALPKEGGRAQQLEGFQSAQFPEPTEAETTSAYLRPGQDGTVWVTERVFLQTYDLPEGFDPENDRKVDYISFRGISLVLRQLDGQGNELLRFDAGDLLDRLGVEDLYDLWMDDDGDFLVNAGSLVAVLDSHGEVRFTLKNEQSIGASEFIRLSCGKSAILGRRMGEDGYPVPSLLTIDKENQEWGTYWTLPPQTLYIFDGDDDAMFYYINGDKLYAWPEDVSETKDTRRVLSWADSGISANSLSFISFLEDGHLAAMELGPMGGMSETRICFLTPTAAADVPDRTVVTYGALALTPSEQREIADFNRESRECYISVIEYNQLSTYQENLTALITDILAGNAPDIITQGELVNRLGAAGMLEDLWPYIDEDPDLGRDALMLRPLQALEQSGKLYQIGGTFGFETLVGARDIVGDRMSWTPEDLWAALETMPEGCRPLGLGYSGTRTEFLRTLVSLEIGNLVDWETGTCHFDSQEFQDLLEFCAAFPEAQTETFEEMEVLNGNQMLIQSICNSFDDLKRYETLFGGEFSFVGYPNRQGRVGSRFIMPMTYAISAACQNKEAAWSFVRTKLVSDASEPDDNSYTTFSINKEDFQQIAEFAMTPKMEKDRDGVLREVPRWRSGIIYGEDEINFLYNHITKKQYEQLMALYEATEGVDLWDYSITDIVTEMAGAYFVGDKTLEESCALIQNRMELYVNERR